MANDDTRGNSAANWFGYVVLVLATALGLWAIGTTLVEGHTLAATTQHVPWGLWVAMYIFFLGLSAGSFLLSSLIYAFNVKRWEPAGPPLLLQSLGCLILGGILIILDLGHPGRVYLVLTSFNHTSVMAWMGLFYNVYLALILAQLYFAFRHRFVQKVRDGMGAVGLYRLLALGSTRFDPESLRRDRKWLRGLGILAIPVTVFISGGVGTIFAVAKARPGWFGGLFPIIFLVSALLSAAALLTFLTAAFSRARQRNDLVRSLARVTVSILAVDLLLLLSEVLTTLYGGIPNETTGWRMTLFGPYWWVFWFVQIGIGAVIPILLVSLPGTRNRVNYLGAAGLFVVIGMVGTRLNIVVPAQIIPSFAEAVGAYNHFRFETGYFPSLNEWLVTLGIFSIGVWLFLSAFRFFPLEDVSQPNNSYRKEVSRHGSAQEPIKV